MYIPLSGAPGDTPHPDELVEALRGQLAEVNAANRENLRIIAGLVQRISELPEAPADPPPQAAQDAPQSGAEGEGRGAVPPEPERGAERPWWRRIFGG